MRWRTRLDSLLQSIQNPKSLPQISQIHQQLLIGGGNADGTAAFSPFSVTKLLQLYAAAGDHYSAHHLFNQLPQPPNIFAWTALLDLHSPGPETLTIYACMRRSGVAPDAYALPPAIRSAVSATVIHADAVKFAAADALSVVNALVGAYARHRDVSAARQMFDESLYRDLITYNSLISAYVTSRLLTPALELISSMQSDGWDPDTVTWNILIDGYCRAERCNEAVEILTTRIPDPNVVSFTTLIVGLSRCADHEAALNLFRRMIMSYSVPPDQDTLSAVLSSCRQLAALRPGQQVHTYGLKSSIPLQAFYFSAGAALVVMYATCGKIKAAEMVFRLLDPTDVVTWNALIKAFCQASMGSAALEYFKKMILRGVRSDEITLATILSSCELDAGKQIHARVIRYRYHHATAVCNALISMYSRSGCIRAAHSVFSRMNAPDVISWNTMIGGLGSNGRGKAAIQLLDQMCQTQVHPNDITFTSSLAACSHSGLVDEGLKVYRKLTEDFGLIPSTRQYASIVDLLARAGRFHEAVEFARRCPARAEGCIWGTILAASHDYQNVEFGKLAFEELVVLEPENAGNYATISNLYARMGRFEEAKMIRKMMEKRELVKPSGYSWVEIEYG